MVVIIELLAGAHEGSYVSYLEGCTAPSRDENQLHEFFLMDHFVTYQRVLSVLWNYQLTLELIKQVRVSLKEL